MAVSAVWLPSSEKDAAHRSRTSNRHGYRNIAAGRLETQHRPCRRQLGGPAPFQAMRYDPTPGGGAPVSGVPNPNLTRGVPGRRISLTTAPSPSGTRDRPCCATCDAARTTPAGSTCAMTRAGSTNRSRACSTTMWRPPHERVTARVAMRDGKRRFAHTSPERHTCTGGSATRAAAPCTRHQCEIVPCLLVSISAASPVRKRNDPMFFTRNWRACGSITFRP